jgi:hypothetical protein
MQDQTLSDRLRAAARDRDFAGADPHGDAALMRKAAAELERLSARGPVYWLIDEDNGNEGETFGVPAIGGDCRPPAPSPVPSRLGIDAARAGAP